MVKGLFKKPKVGRLRSTFFLPVHGQLDVKEEKGFLELRLAP